MRRVLSGLAVVVLVACVVIGVHVLMRTAPGISLVLKTENGEMSTGLPAANGYLRHDSMTFVNSGRLVAFTGTQKVVSSPGGGYTVVADYVVQRNGAKHEIHRQIPVLKGQPQPATWTELDGDYQAYAYLNGDNVRY